MNSALEEDLQQLDVLDEYNNTVRKEDLNNIEGEFNSDDDEAMFEINSLAVNGLNNVEILEHDNSENNGEEDEKEEECTIKESQDKKKKHVSFGETEEKKLEQAEEEDSEEDSDDEDDDEEDEEEELTREEKKKKPKAPKEKKPAKTKEDSNEFIDKILKKKFKPRKIVSQILTFGNHIYRLRRIQIRVRRRLRK